ncbi:MAG: hypothetical protein ACQERN_03365 [Thermodesulfobacteriota bacterium]
MEQLNVLRQMINFNKTAFDSAYNALEMGREQNDTMINSFLEQATWLPEESKTAIRQWLESYKKGCRDLKTTMDQSYEQVKTTLEKQTGEK